MIEIKLDADTLRQIIDEYDCDISVNVDDEVEQLLKDKLVDGFVSKCDTGKCTSFHLTPQVNSLVSNWVKRLVETDVGNYLRVGQQDISMEVMKQVNKQFEHEVESAVRCRMKKLGDRMSDLLDKQQSKINDELGT